MARIKVKGAYINARTYELRKEDGEVYMVIREGEPFRIANQLRSWVPVRVPKKSGRGTILMCQKYNDRLQHYLLRNNSQQVHWN